MRNLYYGVVAALLMCVTGSRGAMAQAPAAAAPANPTITVILSSSQELLDDLKFVIETLGQEPARFKTLEETLTVFMEGVDRVGPVGLRSFLTNGNLIHVLSVPINDPKALKVFLDNLSALDIKNKPVAGNPNLYQLLKLFVGWVHYIPNIKTAHVSDDQQEVLKLATAVPANLLNGRDMIAILDNSAQPPKDRQTAFKKVKENLSAVKPAEKEDPADFEIRKLAIDQQLTELERFFVESSKVSAGWTLSAAKKQAVLDLNLAALPKTSLAESIELLAKTPDHFAGVGNEETILSGSVNFAIDALRKQHLQASAKLWRPRMKSKIDGNMKLTDDQKEVRRTFVDLGLDVLDGVLAEGVFNGFLRVQQNSKDSSFVSVGALRVPDGKAFEATLAKLKDRVKLNVETVHEVAIHTVSVPDMKKDFPEFFGGEPVIYFGTSKNALWYATGTDALDKLKAAISQVQQAPAAAPVSTVLNFSMKVGPWSEFGDKHPSPVEEKLSDKEKKNVREMRKLGIDAMKAGNDTLSLKLERDAEEVKLHLQFDEGLLRAAGKLIGKGIKDNLE